MNSFLENRPNLARQEGGTITMPKQETTFQPMFGAASTASAPAQKPEPGPAAEGQVEAGPQVELVQNKGRVERIIVTCTCCKRIELQCQY